MRYHRQKARFHRPDKGRFGDCYETALACILDMELEAMPSFGYGLGGGLGDMMTFAERVRKWTPPGIYIWTFDFKAPCMEELLDWCGERNPGARYIVYGGTKRPGNNHAVCCRGNEIEWNPGGTNLHNVIVHPMWPERTSFNISLIGRSV